MSGNSLIEETPSEVLAGVIERLRRLLPGGWDVALSYDEELGVVAPIAGRADALLAIRAPDGTTASLLVEVRVGHMRDAGRVVERIRRLADDVGRPAILVVPYIGPGLRQQCTSSGVSYLDLTGWCQLEVSSPPMVIQSVGVGQDPRPPRSSIILRLNGVGAGRVVRSLLDDDLPAGVRDVTRRATVSPGTVSKVLKALEAEAIVTRDESGRIEAVWKRHLVDRWIRDYSFLKTNAVGWVPCASVDRRGGRRAGSRRWLGRRDGLVGGARGAAWEGGAGGAAGSAGALCPWGVRSRSSPRARSDRTPNRQRPARPAV